MKLRVLKSIEGCQVHYADPDILVSSIGMTLSVEARDRNTPLNYGLGATGIISHAIDASSVATRLLRRGVHSARRSRHDGSRLIVQVDNRLVAVRIGNETKEVELHRMKNGRRVLRRGWCEAEGGEIVVGEYWSNANRESVRIFVAGAGGGATVPYEFASGQVRHIHALEYDPFDHCVWITTGDRDDECMIGLLDDEFALGQIVGRGEQQWRAVSLAFDPKAVYWGTDSHSGANSILRLDRSSREITYLGDVIGPVYYNVQLPGFIVFSTAMEKGEGEQDGFARLYGLDVSSGRVEEIRRERKDRLSPKWFGYGLFEFAEGSLGGNRFWVTAKGLRGGLRSELLELTE